MSSITRRDFAVSAAAVAASAGLGLKPSFADTNYPSRPIQMICPNLRCRKFLAVPDDVRGKLVKCQHCQTNFRVPEAKKGVLPVKK